MLPKQDPKFSILLFSVFIARLRIFYVLEEPVLKMYVLYFFSLNIFYIVVVVFILAKNIFLCCSWVCA